MMRYETYVTPHITEEDAFGLLLQRHLEGVTYDQKTKDLCIPEEVLASLQNGESAYIKKGI